MPPVAAAGPASVRPDRILHDLEELWTTFGKPDVSEGTEGAGVLRACAMTLIVFVDDESDSMALGETLALLMRDHPSRAIVVRIRDGSGVLEARVFAQCWMPFGQHRQICCEQVEIAASLDRIADLSSIVSPLAAPDLPTVVCFRSARITEAASLGSLLELGDKIVVDSALPGAPAFADLRAMTAAGLIVGDLAWTRLTKLRELIFQLLDGRDPGALRNITIEYCGNEAAPEGRYLQAWFRSELVGATVELRRAGVEGRGQITVVRIGPDINVKVESNCAKVESGSLSQRVNVALRSEHELLSEELGITAHDRVFERALLRMTPWNPRS